MTIDERILGELVNLNKGVKGIILRLERIEESKKKIPASFKYKKLLDSALAKLGLRNRATVYTTVELGLDESYGLEFLPGRKRG